MKLAVSSQFLGPKKDPTKTMVSHTRWSRICNQQILKKILGAFVQGFVACWILRRPPKRECPRWRSKASASVIEDAAIPNLGFLSAEVKAGAQRDDVMIGSWIPRNSLLEEPQTAKMKGSCSTKTSWKKV